MEAIGGRNFTIGMASIAGGRDGWGMVAGGGVRHSGRHDDGRVANWGINDIG